MGQFPNILLLLTDQHRGDWLPYDDRTLDALRMPRLSLRMPTMARLMGEGMAFTRAISPAPVCCPARACLASGLRYRNIGVPNNDVPYPLAQRTFYSALREHGYRVGIVGKAHFHGSDRPMALDGSNEDAHRLGFTDFFECEGKIESFINGYGGPKGPYLKYLYDHGLADTYLRELADTYLSYLQFRGSDPNKQPEIIRERMNPHSSGCGAVVTQLPEEAYIENWLADRAARMLRGFSSGDPWFLQVCFTNPHGPWPITQEMNSAWENTPFPPPNRTEDRSNRPAHVGNPDATSERTVRQHYAAMLENIDRHIGTFVDLLDQRGELDNTLVIYSADHGEMLGDFYRYNKGRPERGSAHIPLVVWGPGIVHAASSALVELQDLAATILDYASTSMPEAVDSLSFRPVLEGRQTAHRPYQVAELGGWQMICDDRFKLVVERDGERLYDLIDDPWENENIAGEHRDIVAHLARQLRKELS